MDLLSLTDAIDSSTAQDQLYGITTIYCPHTASAPPFTVHYIMCLAIGFGWGYFIGHSWGYEHGRHDTIKQMERQLKENPHRASVRV